MAISNKILQLMVQNNNIINKGSNLLAVEVEEGDAGDEGIPYLTLFDGGGVKLDIIVIYKNKDIINCNDGLCHFETLKQ